MLGKVPTEPESGKSALPQEIAQRIAIPKISGGLLGGSPYSAASVVRGCKCQ